MIGKPSLIWTVPNLFDDIIEWTRTRVWAAFGLKQKPLSTIELTSKQAWQTNFSAPVKNRVDLKSALLQALPTLSPIPPQSAVIYAAPADEKMTVNVLVLAAETYETIIRVNRDAGGLFQDGKVFKLKQKIHQTRLRAGLAAGVLIGIVLLAETGLAVFNTQNETSLANLRGQEQTLRAELKTRTDAARQQTALERFMASEPEHLTPIARLNLLNELSEATPDSTYWTGIEIEEDRVRIEARSLDAARDLATMQENLAGWSVSLDGPISAESSNRESFAAELKRSDEGG